jgi:hypothetical protein
MHSETLTSIHDGSPSALGLQSVTFKDKWISLPSASATCNIIHTKVWAVFEAAAPRIIVSMTPEYLKEQLEV